MSDIYYQGYSRQGVNCEWGLSTLVVTLHCHLSHKIIAHTHPTLLAMLISDIHIRVLCYFVQ